MGLMDIDTQRAGLSAKLLRYTLKLQGFADPGLRFRNAVSCSFADQRPGNKKCRGAAAMKGMGGCLRANMCMSRRDTAAIIRKPSPRFCRGFIPQALSPIIHSL